MVISTILLLRVLVIPARIDLTYSQNVRSHTNITRTNEIWNLHQNQRAGIVAVQTSDVRAAAPGTCPDGSIAQSYNCTKPGLICTESIPADLIVPEIDNCTATTCLISDPKPGRRIASVVPQFKHTSVFHTIYLPPNFTSTRRWPLIVEFSGNDIEPQDGNWTCNGFGISQGRDYIWLSLPFLSAEDGNRTCNQRVWWGCDPSACDSYIPESQPICQNKSLTPSCYDPEPTVRYTLLAVRQVIQQFNVDPKRVLLTGHSRGAIAVNYIGLYNDTIASLWSAFAPTSHYDGVQSWDFNKYRGKNLSAYRHDALERLRRIGDRPVWIAAECDLATSVTRDYLEGTGVNLSNFVFRGTGFKDHNSFWSLRADPGQVRRDLREWVKSTLGPR